MNIDYLIEFLSRCRLSLEDEKITQHQLAERFTACELQFEKEFHLDNKNTIDFFFQEAKIGIEIKIGNHSKKQIYKQIVRYCGFESIETIILLTNKIMALPPAINNKKTVVINLGRAWI